MVVRACPARPAHTDLPEPQAPRAPQARTACVFTTMPNGQWPSERFRLSGHLCMHAHLRTTDFVVFEAVRATVRLILHAVCNRLRTGG